MVTIGWFIRGVAPFRRYGRKREAGAGLGGSKEKTPLAESGAFASLEVLTPSQNNLGVRGHTNIGRFQLGAPILSDVITDYTMPEHQAGPRFHHFCGGMDGTLSPRFS